MQLSSDLWADGGLPERARDHAAREQSAGLVTEDAEVRRLADLLLFNDVPYRGAQVIEAAIEKKIVNLDDKLYEKLANCWIAAGEYDKSIAPLQRAAEMAATGDTFMRLGEVQVQREDWPAAIAAVQRGIDKGQLRDPANAQLMTRHRALQPEELRGCSAVLRACPRNRNGIGRSSRPVPAGHPGSQD